MLRILRFASVVCLALFCQNAAWPQTESALIPREAIFTEPDKDQVMLSSDGKWVGYRANSDDTRNLWIAPIDKPTQARAVTKQRATPVLDYRWTNLSGYVLYRVPSEGGTSVVLLNIDTGESRNLTPGKGVTAWIEKLSPDHVDEALLRVQATGQANVEYRRLNLRTGRADTIFKNERGFDRVLFDDDWQPHVAVLPKPKGGYELWQRNRTGRWVPFAQFRDGAETDASQPIMLDKSGKTLYLTDNRGRDKAALQSIDLASSAVSAGESRPTHTLPLLIYVHGGPWGVYPWNDWNTNRCLQLLTDRGYAVLRVEFRESQGFGRKVSEG